MTRVWASFDNNVYDFTDYVYTQTFQQDASSEYDFLNDDIINIFKERAGQDVTGPLNQVLAGLDEDTVQSNLNCMNNAFKVGEVDFRKSPRCLVQNYMLLAFSSIVIATIAAKCKCHVIHIEQSDDYYPLFNLYSLSCFATDIQAITGNAGQICHLSSSLLY